MKRGITTFSRVFNDTVHNPITDSLEDKKKGRSIQLIKQRNALLLTRYWFYGHYSSIRYEIIISMLSKEFFLSDRSICNIIGADKDFLFKLRKEKPTKKTLRALYPFLIWEV